MKHHIVAIGVSKHSNSQHNLSYAAKDATEAFSLLTNNLGNIGYTKLLVNSEATLGSIRSALGAELQQSVKSDDAFIFYYSGHGAVDDDPHDNTTGVNYLVPFDGTLDFANSCIPVTYLKNIFNQLPSKAKVVFVDACFSGAVSKFAKIFPAPKKKAIYKKTKSFANTLDGNGTLIFTASQENETALEDPEFENGLFTHYVLEELQKERQTPQFPIIDIFSPISAQVKERAQTKYMHTQTPTFYGELKQNVLIPVFKNKLKIAPQALTIPQNSELQNTTFQTPIFELPDKEQEKMLNDLISLVTTPTNQTQNIQDLIFEKNCAQLMKKIKEDWERIFNENGGAVSEIPNSVAKLEAASFQFLMLGAVVAAFGTEKQMDVYAKYALEFWMMTNDKAGLVALIAAPKVILSEIIYTVGMICLAKENFKPWQILLEKRVYDFSRGDAKPEPLIAYNYVHYSEALGGNADKVNDYIRGVLKSLTWLQELAPQIEGKIDDYQLQTNFLLVMLTNTHGSHLWADFGRFYANRIYPLIQKIKYDPEVKKQLSILFGVKPEELRPLLIKHLNEIKKSGMLSSGYFWSSIDSSDLLTEEEKQIQKAQANK